MWMILQNDKPEDFVIATGEQHSVREFCQRAFHYAGIELRWEGEGIDEKGIDQATGKVLVEVSPDFYRPTDVVNLLGDPTKAKRQLGWNPSKTSFDQLVKLMVDNDMAKVASDDAAAKVRFNLAEYLEKGIVK
jgi:GDPmannose 4,6-dehydratase